MEMNFSDKAINDRDFWLKSGNKKIQGKITELLKSIQLTPYSGIGKPEPLKYALSGNWSRRINHEHRLVYHVDEEGQIITILSLRGHY